MGVRGLPHFIRSNTECEYIYDLPAHLSDLEEDLHVIVDGNAASFPYATRHTFLLWDSNTTNNSVAFRAAVIEECLVFIDGIAKVGNVKAISVIFDGNAVGSAKREEWIRRRRRREKAARWCRRLIRRMKNNAHGSRSSRSMRRLLQHNSRGAISFNANLWDNLATELSEMLNHHQIDHTVAIAQTEGDEECARATIPAGEPSS
jgi:hypothetical protein